MKGYLDFENDKYEKGYAPFVMNAENIRANIGKKICYVNYVEPYRGTYFVRYGTIHSLKRNVLFLNEGHDTVNIKSIIECGIKIETDSE